MSVDSTHRMEGRLLILCYEGAWFLLYEDNCCVVNVNSYEDTYVNLHRAVTHFYLLSK
jgi:hypothetical protein